MVGTCFFLLIATRLLLQALFILGLRKQETKDIFISKLTLGISFTYRILIMLKAESYTFKARDGKEISYTLWPIEKSEPIKGVVQIAHGIGEHIGRYEEVALALNREGFVVYGSDHRGHGLTANNGKTLGQYARENFWEDT